MIEIPRGSRSKYEFDGEIGRLSGDGDPLDVLLLALEPEVKSWRGPSAAWQVIEPAQQAFRKKKR